MKIVITESQYRVLFNRPNEVIFGGINEVSGRKSTIDDFKAKVPKEHRNDDGSLKYIYPDKFDGMKSKIILNCPKKGHGPFEIPQAVAHLMGQGCPECGREEKETEFIKKAQQRHQNEDGTPKYTYDNVNYVNISTEVSITCPKHGDFPQIPKNHLSGFGCSKCSGLEKLTTDSFIKKAQQRHQNEDGTPKYTYDNVNYVNSRTEVSITCPKHGDFPQIPSQHLDGKGCPTCRESKGEKIIKDYLSKNYTLDPPGGQKKFKDCTNAHKGEDKKCAMYKFDVYVPEINTIVEYDGEQHFKDIPHWDKKCDLNCRIENDKHKNEYCAKKGIKMIRISYNEKDIIEQLKKGLKSKEKFWISENYPKEGWNK